MIDVALQGVIRRLHIRDQVCRHSDVSINRIRRKQRRTLKQIPEDLKELENQPERIKLRINEHIWTFLVNPRAT